MGCGGSKLSPEEQEALARSKAIEAQLAAERMALQTELKLLILGTGESGKSTVMKQLTILHKGGFSPAERYSYREIIHSNTVQSMQAILDALPALNIKVLPENDGAATFLEGHDTRLNGGSGNGQVEHALLTLWNDPNIRNTILFRKYFQLNDSAEYFFDSISRTFRREYMPTDDDIVRARVRTTGIIESKVKIGRVTYKIFDVGGQRSERRKWLNVFDGVDALLFLVAISEYDQTLFEDQQTARLEEALLVWAHVVNSQFFTKSAVIMFLNKIDLFKAKLAKSSLSSYYPEFKGNDLDYTQTSEWMWTIFQRKLTTKRPVYHHFTCATDTNSMSVVVKSLDDNITSSLITSSGLV